MFSVWHLSVFTGFVGFSEFIVFLVIFVLKIVLECTIHVMPQWHNVDPPPPRNRELNTKLNPLSPQDDIIDDVEDFVAAAEILKERGAYKICIMATHGLLSAEAPRLIEESAIDEVKSCVYGIIICVILSYSTEVLIHRYMGEKNCYFLHFPVKCQSWARNIFGKLVYSLHLEMRG